MTFLAKPNDLNSIFTGLMYEGFVEGIQPIYISIYDGEGGNCLSSNEHHMTRKRENFQGPSTIFNGCIVSTGKLLVSVLAYDEDRFSTKLNPVPLQLMVALLSGFVLLFIYGYIACCHQEKFLSWRFRNQTKRDQVSNQSKKELIYDEMDLSQNEEQGLQSRGCYSNSINEKEYLDGGMRDEPSGNSECEEDKSKERVEDTSVGEKTMDDIDMRVPPSHPNVSPEFEPNTASNGISNEVSQDQRAPLVGSDVYSLNERKGEAEHEEKFLDDEENGIEWLQYFDSSTGDFYYESTMTREVTWTKPEHFLRVDDELDTT